MYAGIAQAVLKLRGCLRHPGAEAVAVTSTDVQCLPWCGLSYWCIWIIFKKTLQPYVYPHADVNEPV